MNNFQFFDDHGVSHVNNQGIIELAYTNNLANAQFEWQDSGAKDQYLKMSEYLDTWPFTWQQPSFNLNEWFTPEDYASIDLHSHVLALCQTPEEQARAKIELDIIQQLDVEHIFKHLIYLVDTWTKENLVWGVGRGSSVSCFVLYVIGLNKINPLDYDLDPSEFFKTSMTTDP